MDANLFRTHTLQDERILRILAAALDAVEPGKIVRDFLATAKLPPHKRIFLLGIGKASEAMTFSAADVLTQFTDALIVTKRASHRDFKRATVIEAGHPIPDSRSLAAGQAALNFVSRLDEDDLLICLISGGGSALVAAPKDGITLDDMQSLTRELLSCGASIGEVNLLRSKLDRIKGGGLARATKAKIVNLILSDVLGNPLEIIASGPTVTNSKNNSDALSILEKYNLQKKTPFSIMNILESDSLLSVQGQAPVLQNEIIGDIRVAANAAQRQAMIEGFDSEILDLGIQGEANEVGLSFSKMLKEERRKRKDKFCLIAGGETTVTIKGTGKGGRNQEVALSAVDELSGVENILLISLATDGDDGPTDAAGAVVNGESRQRTERLGMFAPAYLSRNDAYNFFSPLDDLIKCGYSGTNVNDLIFMFGL